MPVLLTLVSTVELVYQMGWVDSLVNVRLDMVANDAKIVSFEHSHSLHVSLFLC